MIRCCQGYLNAFVPPRPTDHRFVSIAYEGWTYVFGDSVLVTIGDNINALMLWRHYGVGNVESGEPSLLRMISGELDTSRS